MKPHLIQFVNAGSTAGSVCSRAKLAAAEEINWSYLCHILRLTLLAPETVEAIMDGR